MQRGEKLVEWLAGCRGTVVSPHPDDAALSIGGLLGRIAGRCELTLVTVFSRSRWVRPGWIGRRGEAAISRVRREEESAFAEAIGATLHLLNLPDASLRGYDAASELELLRDPQDWQRHVRALVASRLALVDPDFVIAPAAIGGHVDHILVRSAVCEWASSARGTVFLYEDLPYKNRAAQSPGARPARFPITIDIRAQRAAKLALLSFYPSQLDPFTCIDICEIDTNRVGGSETLWTDRKVVYGAFTGQD